jgi:putative multiple sugar transport system permease protein
MEFIKKNMMTAALIVTMLILEVLIREYDRGSLFAPRNITNLIAQNGYVVLLAVGMLLCILTGGNIDLSAGSQVCLIAAVGATLMVKMGVNIYAGIAVCLVCGMVLGAWQGFWTAYVGIPSFIVTLAGMLTFRGLALVLLDGKSISPMPADFTRIFNSFFTGGTDPESKAVFSLTAGLVVCLVLLTATLYSRINRARKGYGMEPAAEMLSRLGFVCVVVTGVFYAFGNDRGVPALLILLGAVVAAYAYFTSKTVPGRYLYAMGGNEKAARMSGVDTKGMLFFAYTNMGFLSAAAALVCLARFNLAFPDMGRNYELDAIGACFIGGASAYGGVGTVGGVLVGTVFMGVLNNGMSILGIDQNRQQAVKGAVLLAAVIADVVSKKRKKARSGAA